MNTNNPDLVAPILEHFINQYAPKLNQVAPKPYTSINTSTSSANSTTNASNGIRKTDVNTDLSPIDLLNNPDSYEIWVNVPGFTKECIEVTLKDKVLRIVGTSNPVKKPSNLSISRRSHQDSFVYQFKLRMPINVELTQNSLVNGVFYLKLFKSQPDEVRIPL